MTRASACVLCLSLFGSHPLAAQDTTTVYHHFPLIDVHLGAGWVSGGRIGTRIHLSEEYSVEASIGKHIANFLSASDEETRYGIGVNWHGFLRPHLTLSALVVYGQKVHLRPNDIYLMSLNVGYMPWKPSRLNFTARAGMYVGAKRNFAGWSTLFGPNLDIGIGWLFP